MACFSDVASPCMSTTIIGVSVRSSRSSSSALRNGQSIERHEDAAHEVQHAHLVRRPPSRSTEPTPGVPAGIVGGAEEQVLLDDVAR